MDRTRGLEKPDVAGFSLGGGVALQMAVQFPEKVGRLVSASAHIRRDAVYPDMLARSRARTTRPPPRS